MFHMTICKSVFVSSISIHVIENGNIPKQVILSKSKMQLLSLAFAWLSFSANLLSFSVAWSALGSSSESNPPAPSTAAS